MNKYLVVSKVERGFIVTFKFGDKVKATAVYLDLSSHDFIDDVEAFFRPPTEDQLRALEKKANEPVV